MSWRTLVKNFLERRNIVLSKPPGQFNVLDIKLRQLKNRGATFASALDGGAHLGEWTQMFQMFFPASSVVMVEPREDVRDKLTKMASSGRNLFFSPTLLGRENGTVEFFHADERSSILPDFAGHAFGRRATAQMTTMDSLFDSLSLPLPEFIKLDLQGAELQALQGASRSLEHAQAVLLEVSFLPFQQAQPVLADVISFMSERGFSVYDITGLWHRELDGALGQGDFLFLKTSHPLRHDPRWSDDSKVQG